MLGKLAKDVSIIPRFSINGKVSGIRGMCIYVKGLVQHAKIGSLCLINGNLKAEVVAIEGEELVLLSYGDTSGVGANDTVSLMSKQSGIYPTREWLGRIVNGLGEPIDGKGLLPRGDELYSLKKQAPQASARGKIGEKIDTGIKGLNTFLNICRGQRMGIFAGSGVGKSMLIAMLAKYSAFDCMVIGLIGERGREVQEFIEDYLGEEGLKRSIIVVSTSDESALLRRSAAYLTFTLAEYFSDQNFEVLCMVDSVTRFAMSLREIGLAIGESATSKGYTPSVFSELPKLLERSGPMEKNKGAITGLFSVLVEGDDHNEPITDAVRGIIDGHIMLSRTIASRRYPAIDILNSVSRSMPKCNTEAEIKLISEAKEALAVYEDMADMIKIGAYKIGNDATIDKSIEIYQKIEGFIKQAPSEFCDIETSFLELSKLLGKV